MSDDKKAAKARALELKNERKEQAQREAAQAALDILNSGGDNESQLSQLLTALRAPEDFFESGRLLTKKTAQAVSHDLAVGFDGCIYKYESGVYVRAEDEVERRLAKLLGDRYNKGSQLSTVHSYVTKALDLPQLSAAPRGDIINLKNGVYEWKTDTFRDHSPEDLSTVQLAFEFDAEAQCPEFLRWVEEVVPVDSRTAFWEAFGYMLMSGNPLQKAVLIVGVGGSGKSTYLRLVERMIGRQNYTNKTLGQLSGDKFAAADLVGKLANIAGEIADKYMEDSALFKSITGDDTIDAQRKFGQPFSFTPWAVPLFSMNTLPRSSDTTGGFYRRLLLLEFPNKVIGTRKLDEQVLFDEAPGIFNVAMASLRVLMERGEFEPLGSMNDLLEQYKTSNSSVLSWLADADLVSEAGNPLIKTQRSALYMHYKFWCKGNGCNALAASKVYEELRQNNFTESKIQGVRFINGIRLAPGLKFDDLYLRSNC